MLTCQSCNIPFTKSEAKFCAICGTPAPRYSALENPAPTQNSAWPSAEQAAAEAAAPTQATALVQHQVSTRADFQAASPTMGLSDSELLRELVKSSNRTTHAIRALVRFIFIQLSFLTLAYILNSFANAFIDPEQCARRGDDCSPNGFLSFLSFAAIVVGIFVSSRVGWAELKESDVPNVNSGTTLGL